MADARPVKRPLWMTLLVQTLLVVFSLVFALPFVWLVGSSVKTDAQIFKTPPEWIPLQPVTVEVEGSPLPVYRDAAGARYALVERDKKTGEARVRPLDDDNAAAPERRLDYGSLVEERRFGLKLANYPEGLAFIKFGRQLRNTLTICILSAIGCVLSCSMVAYGLARVPWRGRKLLFFLLLATMMIPPQVTMVPMFVVWAKLHVVNSYWPLVLPSFLAPAFFVFLLRQFFLSIPKDLTDAAKIEGCSEFGIYWRIVLPLAKPALATVALFAFLGAWNDYLGPLIYLSDESKYTLSLGIASFSSQYGSYPGMLMAVSTVMTVPIIILFFLTQRTFIQGITLTGMKG